MSKCLVFLMLGCISLSLNQLFALLGPSFYVCCISMQVVPQAFHLTKKLYRQHRCPLQFLSAKEANRSYGQKRGEGLKWNPVGLLCLALRDWKER